VARLDNRHSAISDRFWHRFSRNLVQGWKAVKSLRAPMVNRVLTSPYLWWFDVFPIIGLVARPLLKVLAFQTWQ
jgi:hypothetical protein